MGSVLIGSSVAVVHLGRCLPGTGIMAWSRGQLVIDDGRMNKDCSERRQSRAVAMLRTRGRIVRFKKSNQFALGVRYS